ncbi:hypothetical protein GCM10029964_104300 [Kibdelosporangium lantanae]
MFGQHRGQPQSPTDAGTPSAASKAPTTSKTSAGNGVTIGHPKKVDGQKVDCTPVTADMVSTAVGQTAKVNTSLGRSGSCDFDVETTKSRSFIAVKIVPSPRGERVADIEGNTTNEYYDDEAKGCDTFVAVAKGKWLDAGVQLQDSPRADACRGARNLAKAVFATMPNA